jgi:IS5 family transposase
MAHRRGGQLSLADGLVAQVGVNRSLERLAEAVDWSCFEALLKGVYASPRGRPSYPPLVLFKCLLLQQWYRLSDPALEEAVADRLSFRRFVGLALDERVPDHSTLNRFRARLADANLADANLAERLFDELARQLSVRGLVLRQGTLIDATVVQADATPLPHERAHERSDQDAGFIKTFRGYRFGYKAHVAMDEGSRLIRRAVLTPANVHDAQEAVVKRLVQGDEAYVFADRAYDCWHMHFSLKKKGIGNGVLRRRWSRAPLPADLVEANRRHAPRRVAIESLFGLMKRGYGYARVRYRDLTRNRVQLQLLCMALNLRRMLVLTG